jgi:N-formylglutamate amidohydrolase
MAQMASDDSRPSDSQLRPGGAIPGSDGQAAFSLHRPRQSAIPILIAVPHAGRSYPASLLDRMRHPEETAPRLEDRYIDLVARRLARETGAALLLAHAPRAMIDLNRSPEDVDWEMVTGPRSALARARLAAGRRSRSGLGLVPRRLPAVGELWRGKLRQAELDERIEQVHAPYHMTLAHTLESLRDRWGAALLLDLHSMPPLGSKSGEDAAADFVIGDRFGASCAGNYVNAALDYLEAQGRRVTHNRPYAGGYVLDRHGAPARGLSAMQLEVCRTTYLDAALREPGDDLDSVTDLLTGLVRRLAYEVTGSAQGLAQAAE